MDSPLSIIASIVSILTFLYAILAGIYFVFRTASHTQDGLQQIFHSLIESQVEVRNVMIMIEASTKPAEDDRSHGLAASVDLAAKKANQRIEVFMTLTRQIIGSESKKTRQNYLGIVGTIFTTPTSPFWEWLAYRRRFVSMQKDLQKRMLEKDIAMETLRRAKDRSVQLHRLPHLCLFLIRDT